MRTEYRVFEMMYPRPWDENRTSEIIHEHTEAVRLAQSTAGKIQVRNVSEWRDPDTVFTVSEMSSAVGERSDWRAFWLEHSLCGGTWTYVEDEQNPRVLCSCGVVKS